MADKKLRLQWIQEQAELKTLNPKTTQKTCKLVSHTHTHTPSHVWEKRLLYNDHYNYRWKKNEDYNGTMVLLT